MTEEKMRKTITASVVAGTMLLVFLLAVLIYQWITLAVYNKRIAKAEEENKKLEEVIEEQKFDLEYYQSVMGKEWLAFQDGWVKGDK
jgi:hypothetical protein